MKEGIKFWSLFILGNIVVAGSIYSTFGFNIFSIIISSVLCFLMGYNFSDIYKRIFKNENKK